MCPSCDVIQVSTHVLVPENIAIKCFCYIYWDNKICSRLFSYQAEELRFFISLNQCHAVKCCPMSYSGVWVFLHHWIWTYVITIIDIDFIISLTIRQGADHHILSGDPWSVLVVGHHTKTVLRIFLQSCHGVRLTVDIHVLKRDRETFWCQLNRYYPPKKWKQFDASAQKKTNSFSMCFYQWRKRADYQTFCQIHISVFSLSAALLKCDACFHHLLLLTLSFWLCVKM